MNIKKLNRALRREFGGRIRAYDEDGCTVLRGCADDWDEAVRVCQMCAEPYSRRHVVNDLAVPGGSGRTRLPEIRDDYLSGARPDVLIIGGGISGATIARELSRKRLDILLVEKEGDLALGASGRNDGEIHPGVDLKRGSLKHKYVRRGNRMYPELCRELGVRFSRRVQYVGFMKLRTLPGVAAYCVLRRVRDGISDTRIIFSRGLRKSEPELNSDFKFAIKNPFSGCVCPYGLTIACAENAVQNGARVALNTAVLGMSVRDGVIEAVRTNRGELYPRIVINAAGVFAEETARMACDRFYSIHPRRGTSAIMDKRAGERFSAIASVKNLGRNRSHSKGGGVLSTVDGNLLVGPDAIETREKENTETTAESIAAVFNKQRQTVPTLSERDIITYFTGVRAATFEEDFIIEQGRKTKNLIHCAGIQSPGLTTAPAVAQDIAAMALKMLGGAEKIPANETFNPVRPRIPTLRELDDEQRAALIAENPDYGEIICRCEEISRGEILDALRLNICVPTLDGVKKRVRPGMGRCQGGFCGPLVTEIIAEFLGIPPEEVKKGAGSSPVAAGRTKGGEP